ncbi:MAG: FHA domain-containing protein, partial [Elusimicrobiota bacterium]|nr:FHA domain-containing protein [Elusimicrobiota bacterium]
RGQSHLWKIAEQSEAYFAVSAHHARFFRVGSSYFIEDLDSTNGTFIRGKKILKAEIHNNDQIDIAKHSMISVLEPVEMAAQVPSPTTLPVAVPPVSAQVPSPTPAPVPTLSPHPVPVPSPLTPTPVVPTMGPDVHPPVARIGKIAYLSVIDGVVDKTEIELSQDQVDYIGDTEPVKIKDKTWWNFWHFCR